MATLPRVIPCLLLRRGGLYKTVRFADPKYVGDPMNAVRIFNDKEVDELAILDIGATVDGTGIDFDLIGDIAGEAFMPLCYGGGVTGLADVQRLNALGIEKVAINTASVEDPDVIRAASDAVGSQSIVAAIDVRRVRRRGHRVSIRGGAVDADLDPVAHAERVAELGAGEILLTSIDREGTGDGYDLELVRAVTDAVGVPVIANGGAGSLEHFAEGLGAGAAAVAAGSMFVFHGKHRAVLITYPPAADRRRLVPA